MKICWRLIESLRKGSFTIVYDILSMLCFNKDNFHPRSLHGELFRLCVIHKLIHKLLRIRRRGQQPGGQKAQRHQQGQGPRKEALEVLFHSFFSPLIFLFCLSPSRRGRRTRERQKRDMGQGAASLPHVGSIFTFAGAAAPSSLSLRQGVTGVIY